MASITDMPLDIWRAILVRLPAESLIRTRAVSKGWRAVIDDPCFVQAHTKKHNQQLSSNIFFQKQIPLFHSAIGTCFSLDLEALISNGDQAAIAATPLDLDFFGDKLSHREAECNGLVLTENPLTIWNPLTHERLKLPRGYIKYVLAIGLGYDSTTDDYKAVVILRSRETRVYSLRPDSWRSIMNCPCDESDWRGPFGPGVFVCGGLNWLSLGKLCVFVDKIVALDLGTEKYRLLQMPPQTRCKKNPKSPPGLSLKVLDGCLALCDSGYHSQLDVWVMKVYGDDDSWNKLFSIDWEFDIPVSVWQAYYISPVAFVMKEKLVLLQDGQKCFFLFNVETKSFKSVKIDGTFNGKYTSYLYARQMFAGTIFRLHANCGRKMASSNKKKKKKKKKACADDGDGDGVESLFFCLGDDDGTELTDSICS